MIIERNHSRTQTLEAVIVGLSLTDTMTFRYGLELNYLDFIPQDKKYIIKKLIARIRRDFETIDTELKNQVREARTKKDV